MTAARVGWLSVFAYLFALMVFAGVDNETVKSTPSIVLQVVLIAAAVIIAIVIVGWRLLRNRIDTSAFIAVAILLLLEIGVHLPALLAMLDDIAKVQTIFHDPISNVNRN